VPALASKTQRSAVARWSDIDERDGVDRRPPLTLFAPPQVSDSKKDLVGLAASTCCALMAFWLIASLYVQTNMGLADNGDFARISGVVTSGPASIASVQPTSDSLRGDRNPKYVHYWSPYWNLDFPRGAKIVHSTANSSTEFLWLPGTLWNYLFYSTDVLHAGSLSLLPRILLVAILLLTFRWIRNDPTTTAVDKLVLLATIGIPYLLLTTTTDYLAYLNSFYFETGSLIFLLLFFAAFVHAVRRASCCGRGPVHWCAAALLLLGMAKVSNVYWLWLAVPVTMALCRPGPVCPRVVRAALLTAALTVAAVWFVRPSPDSNCQNSYNRMFLGALTFSDDPKQRLAELGMADCESCLGKSCYGSSEEERRLADAHGQPLPLRHFAYVLWREPSIPFRMMKHAADNMQTLSLPYLRKHSFEEPEMTPGKIANLWSQLKANCFPKGHALFGTLAAYLAIFLAGARPSRPTDAPRLVDLKLVDPELVDPQPAATLPAASTERRSENREPPRRRWLQITRWFTAADTPNLRRELSLLGLLATVACFIDMNVAILGDGRHELTKHLFLANVLFDVATIAAINVALLFALAWARGMRIRRKATSKDVMGLAASLIP
jgi:hypothetical protein